MKKRSIDPYIKLLIIILVCLGFNHIQIIAQEMATGDHKVLRIKDRSTIKFVKSDSELALKPMNKSFRLIDIQKDYDVLSSGIREQKLEDKNLFPVYYKNGVYSNATRYLDTGRVLISFGKENKVDYLTFAEKHGLTFIRETNQLFKTAVFRFHQTDDLIDLTNRLNRLPEVRRASPDWISPRQVR